MNNKQPSNHFIGDDFPFLRLRMGQGRGAIRFAPIEVQIINYPEDLNNDEMWWSNEDKAHSLQVMLQDAIECSRALAGVVNLQDRSAQLKITSFAVSGWKISFHIMPSSAVKPS
jgi:hypothetical protein